MLLEPQQLHEYQKQAVLHQLYNDQSMLWLGLGLGKTVITLTSIVDRMRAGTVSKVLVFGPLRVVQAVWAREAKKWSHTRHLRFSVVHGNPEQRLRALFVDADVYLCNYENMNWLAQQLDHYYLSQGRPLPFQMAVYDEITKVKNSTSLRIAGGKRDRKDNRGNFHKIQVIGWRKFINEFKFTTGLTGTPSSNGYIDLHGQYLVIDGGQRLGEYKTHFQDSYFKKGYNGWGYTVTDMGKQWIEHHISDITLNMESEDHLDMPSVTEVNLMVDLPEKVRGNYAQLEKQLITVLESGSEVELFARATLSNKLLQFCNGSPYINQELGIKGGFEALHDAKLDALESVLEEAGGSPVLCSYTFKSDAQRIMERFKRLKPVNLTAAKSADTEKIIRKWNRGEIRLMIGHPASVGHGIDGLQDSGHIVVWFGLPWSLELYDQMNARIDRQGQSKPVQIIKILCNDTVDMAVVDAIERKTTDQNGLKDAIKRYASGGDTVSFL